MKLLWMLVSIGVVAAGVFMSVEDTGVYLHLPTLILVVGIGLTLTVANHGLTGTLDAFRIGLARNAEVSREAQAALRTMRGAVFGAGVIITLIGFISMLANFEGLQSIRPSMTTSFAAMLYGLFISECLCAPLLTPNHHDALEPVPLITTEPAAAKSVRGPIIGFMCATGLVIIGMGLGSEPHLFLEASMLVVVVGLGFAFVMGNYPIGTVAKCYLGGVRRQPLTAETAFAQHQMFSAIERLIYAAGGIGFLVGLIRAFDGFHDVAGFMTGVAIACLSAIYAVFIGHIFLSPIIHGLGARIVGPQKEPLPQPHNFGLIGLMFCFAFCFILFALISMLKNGHLS
ncbi:MAG: hypothetical protein VX589_00065 [Myxococcota bacterium]|nr:hypothetical protein [Myxococcota bacterium]